MILIGRYTYFIINYALEGYSYSETIGNHVGLNLVGYEITDDGTSERLDEFRIIINIPNRDDFTVEEASEYAEALTDATRIISIFNSLDIRFDDTYDDSCLKENFAEYWKELADMLHWADQQELTWYFKNLSKIVKQLTEA